MTTQPLFFKQYYLACLSHASYMIGDHTTGRAVVVDPQRDIAEYLSDAAVNGLTIDTVIETHFHADFLSGHLELAASTGATIVFGIGAEGRVAFPIRAMKNGERISLGTVDLEILETPGHTPEAISIVVRESVDSAPMGVLTGDTLFIGDVGRPDLLSAVGFNADDLARQLYESLHTKLMTLPDATKVYPAHGAGSSCGKNLSTETVSTIGEQKRFNYALQPMVVEDFIDVVTQGQSVAPLYFLFAATKNREAHPLMNEGGDVAMLNVDDVLLRQAEGAVVIDSREDTTFASGHLHGSINVGLSGRFAEYVGEVMEPDTPIILVTEPGAEAEAKIRLGRIGFDNVLGALDNPIAVFMNRPDIVDQASRLPVAAFAERIASVKSLVTVDIRNIGEVEMGSVPGAQHISLPSLLRSIDQLDKTTPTVVFCAGGYRSSIAASLLRAHGFSDVSDLIGGYTAWSNANIPSSLPVISVVDAASDNTAIHLDIREQDEWDAGHDASATHIAMADLVATVGSFEKDRPIICICRSGNRSGKVAAWLILQGFNAVNMTGGMQQWAADGFAVVTNDGSPGTII